MAAILEETFNNFLNLLDNTAEMVASYHKINIRYNLKLNNDTLSLCVKSGDLEIRLASDGDYGKLVILRFCGKRPFGSVKRYRRNTHDAPTQFHANMIIKTLNVFDEFILAVMIDVPPSVEYPETIS